MHTVCFQGVRWISMVTGRVLVVLAKEYDTHYSMPGARDLGLPVNRVLWSIPSN